MVVLIYAVAITNSLAEQVAHRTPMTPGLRALLSLGVVLVLNLIFLMGRQVTIKVMGFLVFPLIACFLFLSPLFNPRLASGASHQPDAVQPADAPPGLDLYSRDGFRF